MTIIENTPHIEKKKFLFSVVFAFSTNFHFTSIILLQIMVTFEEAAEQAKKLKQTPSNEEMLELYAFYKQATVGDNNTDKWNSWNSKKGTSQDDAKNSYVNLVGELVGKYGLQ
ncbi:acyl coA binding protein domain-containing protein [Ditylenchus destructor]|uniref:Acyl coA binding protein domain-containing protein n=1 Tax=Ditylenchus destructor TaxID=166010 RepID=A0AAD4R5N9_9BILA|nr:acyl coA binding protein domain-containing protein [Ditylenchus destructor]